eukprot:m51a1_g14090 hypothetical protein (186) ;mRNA; r:38987-40942
MAQIVKQNAATSHFVVQCNNSMYDDLKEKVGNIVEQNAATSHFVVQCDNSMYDNLKEKVGHMHGVADIDQEDTRNHRSFGVTCSDYNRALSNVTELINTLSPRAQQAMAQIVDQEKAARHFKVQCDDSVYDYLKEQVEKLHGVALIDQENTSTCSSFGVLCSDYNRALSSTTELINTLSPRGHHV